MSAGSGAAGAATQRPARDVFIVCNNIEEIGGLQRWAHHIAGLLSARGHRVHLVGIVHPSTRHDYGTDLPYTTEVLYDEHPPAGWRPRGALQRLDLRARVRERRRRAGMRQAAARLTEMFRAARPGGVVIVPQVWAMEWVALADTGDLRVVGMSHESYAASVASGRAARVLRLFPDVDRLLLLTAEDADAWIGAGLNNVGVMPNPLPFAPAESSPGLDEPVVVSLGRFSFEKGYDLLVEAWSMVAPAHPGWRLRLYGSGPEREAIAGQVESLGLGDSVELPGQTADVQRALEGASVFALSSRAEGFPISVLEAMACGLACVCFDCAPGVREIVTDGEDGLLVVPGNTEQFAEALGRLMDDKQLRARLGAAARHSVRRFAPETIVDDWERLFEFVYR